MRRAKKRKNLSSARHYDQIRFRFHTTKTHSRHRPIRDFAVKKSPTTGSLSKIQNNSGLSQGLCGRTARHSCYGLKNRSSRWEREHGSSPGLFESKERRALVLFRRGTAHGRLRA